MAIPFSDLNEYKNKNKKNAKRNKTENGTV